MREHPTVSIICFVYNHEKYIRKTLDGFVKQKVNFPIEIIVHDDASTDNSKIIIQEYEKKYPQILKPIYQEENQYSIEKGRVSNICFNNAQGKYITICEGDDYWIDPYKLQKQVDFMEANPKYGVVFTGIHFLYEKTKKLVPSKIHDSEYKFDDLVLGNRISTLTTCIRKDLLDQYMSEIKPELKGWYSGDYPMWLYMSEHSIIKSLPIRTAVYRVLDESASHSKNYSKLLFIAKYRHSVRSFYLKYFNKPQELINKVDLISYREAEMYAVKSGDKEYLNTIHKVFIENKYYGLAFFLKLYKKIPFMYNILFFVERLLIKLKVIKTIKLY